MASESKKTVLVAAAANFTLAVAKAIGGIIGGSAALLAEAAHSVADTTDQGFLLLSLRLGERPPDEDHPFGYGKQRFFWSFLAAVFIFVSGGLFSIGQGVVEMVGGESGGSFLVSYVVLVVAALAEGVSWLRALRQLRSEARESDVPLRRYVRESKDPTVKTVMLEDSGALVGVALATIGVGMHQLTGQSWWDGAASVAIGLLLCYIGVGLGRYTQGLLLGEAATEDDRRKLRRVIEKRDEVVDVKQLMTMVLGPGNLLVAVRLDLADGIPSERVEALATEIDREMREAVPSVKQVFLDPTPEHGEGDPASGGDSSTIGERGEETRRFRSRAG
jgi:cation diffusion facilitator family transporter